MLTLLLGTDWTANLTDVLHRISDDVANQKPNRIFIVPELISHEIERRLCAAAGDTASRFAEVLSFSRLANRVADTVGHGMLPCLDDGGRLVAMTAATRQLHSKLKAYAAVETKPEFLSELVDAVDEFKRCCITSQDLAFASEHTEGSLAQKLEELSVIMETYDSLCLHGKRDPRDQMTWVLEQLEDSDYAKQHVFYIDGFPDFTRQNMAIVEHLIEQAEHVVVSFNCDRLDSENPAFEKAGETAGKLFRFAERCGIGVAIENIAPNATPLQLIRDRLFQGNTQTQACLENCLTVLQADSTYAECLLAAKRVLQLVHQGARYRDISVVCADMETYRHVISLVFNRFGIPAYQSGTEDILEKSVIHMVLSAIDAALGDFEQKDVLRYFKSALSIVEQDTCDCIENYAITWNVKGKLWLDEWANHPNGLGEAWTEETVEHLKQLNHEKDAALSPLLKLRREFHHGKTIKQYVIALYRFLEDIRLSEQLYLLANEMEQDGDYRNAQILNQLWEILLTALEQLHDVLGETAWDVETFTRLFRLLLSQYNVGTIPPVLDAVMIGPVSAMRCQKEKHLLVLGAQEGNLPKYAGTSGVLTDSERTTLRKIGIPLTGGAMDGLQIEYSEIYGVFCGAEETVYVSCTSGQPSFLYRRLLNLSGIEASNDIALCMAQADAMETTAFLVRFGAAEAADHLGLSESYADIKLRSNHHIGNLSADAVKAIYGKKLNLSASQIDKAADCRFAYFLKYGLLAKEQKVATVDPAEFGTYVHAVLEQTAKEVVRLGGFQSISLENTLEIAKKYSDSYVAERFSQIESKRLDYLFNRNKEELAMIVEELWQELKCSKFVPHGFEVAFGDNGQMPAIPILGNAFNAQLRGFVDRVDVWQEDGQNYFRVVDYKTGRKDFDYCDVLNGLGLQMLLYLFALEDNGAALLGEHAIPAGVQYFPARVPVVSADGVLTQEKSNEAREKLWKRKGLLLNDNEVLHAMDTSDKQIRLNYTKKKDGSVSGEVADREQFAMLKAYVYRLLGNMVEEIASGKLQPNPYTRGSSHNACAFCPYGPICHPETVEGRRNYKAITAQRFWEDIERQVKKNGR